jgi:DNA-binding transcriptional LysR family regulator
VRPLMQGIEDAAGEAAGTTALPKGMLRVSVDSLVARVVLGPRIGAFLRAHPALDLDLVVKDHLGDLAGDGSTAPFASATPSRRRSWRRGSPTRGS